MSETRTRIYRNLHGFFRNISVGILRFFGLTVFTREYWKIVCVSVFPPPTIMKVSPTSCLCPVLLCLCFLERGFGASRHGQVKMISRNHNVTHSHNHTKEEETEVHHRPKRGWIWNQFFVLEEHIGPDSQYVGKVGILSVYLQYKE